MKGVIPLNVEDGWVFNIFEGLNDLNYYFIVLYCNYYFVIYM